MSTLQVANLHFESTGNNRIQLATTGTVAIVAAGSNTFVANSTDVNISVGGTNVISANSTAATITGGIVANGSVGTAGQVLVSGGAGANLYWGAGGGNYVLQTYTSNTTWTKPANLKAIKVTVVGAGGGGGSGGGPGSRDAIGGGGGGTSIEYIPAPSIPGPVVVTVGLGGAGAPGSPPSAGSAGGTSSFGAFLSATGGSAGPVVTPGIAPAGTGSGGNINITGMFGNSTMGGSSTLGIGPNVDGASVVENYGAGGAGSFAAFPPGVAPPGGTGASGVVIVEEFY